MDVELKAPGYFNPRAHKNDTGQGRFTDDSELLVGTVANLALSCSEDSSSSEGTFESGDEGSDDTSAAKVMNSSEEYHTAEDGEEIEHIDSFPISRSKVRAPTLVSWSEPHFVTKPYIVYSNLSLEGENKRQSIFAPSHWLLFINLAKCLNV